MAGGQVASTHFFLPTEMKAYLMTDSTFEHVLNSTWVGKISLPTDIALVVRMSALNHQETGGGCG